MKKIIILSLLILLASSSFSMAQEVEEETDEVQERVNQRLENVRSRLKAIIGTVTDKTENTMQIETENNEIGLISINDDASYASTNGNSGAIEYDDIGIGDYVITMGKFDDNKVLDAQRIVVSGQPEEITQEVLFGTITDFEDELIIQLLPESNELKLSVNRSVTITEIDEDGSLTRLTSSSLDPNDRIIIIGSKEEEDFEATRIHIVEQAPEEE